jgi:hypothetical protein
MNKRRNRSWSSHGRRQPGRKGNLRPLGNPTKKQKDQKPKGYREKKKIKGPLTTLKKQKERQKEKHISYTISKNSNQTRIQSHPVIIENDQTKRSQPQPISPDHSSEEIARKYQKEHRNHKKKDKPKKTTNINRPLHIKQPIKKNNRRDQRHAPRKAQRKKIKNKRKRKVQPTKSKKKKIKYKTPLIKNIKKKKRKRKKSTEQSRKKQKQN